MSCPPRTICDVLSEMRTCCHTLDFSYLFGLIEEAQTMANRMEAGLEKKADRIYSLEYEIRQLNGDDES